MKLPDGWKEIKLHEVATIQTGIAKNGNTKGDLIELPYLRVANVQDGYLNLQDIKTIKIPRNKKERFCLKEDDVLLTEGGDFDKLGRGTIWKGQIQNCLHQNHIFAVRTNHSFLMPEYFSCQIAGPLGKKYFLQCSKQSTNLASINSTQLKGFSFLLPSLSEQKAIVDTLSVWDGMIEKTEKLIESEIKKYQWLVYKLIRQPSKKNIWQKNRLHEILKEGSKIPVTDTSQYKKITIKLHKKGIEFADLTREMADTRPFYIRRSGELIIGKQNYFNGSVALVGDEFDGCICSNAIMSFSISDKVNSRFLYEAVSYDKYLKQRAALANGTGQKELTEKDFLNFEVALPSFTEQTTIADTLDVAHHEIDLLRQLTDKYKLQKQGLMQKLLTGQWRIR